MKKAKEREDWNLLEEAVPAEGSLIKFYLEYHIILITYIYQLRIIKNFKIKAYESLEIRGSTKLGDNS